MGFARYSKLLDEYPNLFDNENAPIRIIKNQSDVLAWQRERIQKLAEKDLPSEWADIGILVDDPYMIVLRDLVEFPGGNLNGYVRLIPRTDLSGGAGVIIMPIHNAKILLINHFRHSTRQWHLEIPRGYGVSGISSAENARKELEEEVGATISELISLGSLYPETGFESQRVDLFLAEIISVGMPEVNEGIMSFVWLDVKELEEWIVKEKITDGFTIAAYTKAKLKGLI